MSLQRIKFTVSGRVQGVNFRYYTAKEARKMGVTGHVQNEPDGTVTGEAQGSESGIQDFLKLINQGPTHAQVSKVEQSEIGTKDGEDTFMALR